MIRYNRPYIAFDRRPEDVRTIMGNKPLLQEWMHAIAPRKCLVLKREWQPSCFRLAAGRMI
jgi:hypothetical protein